MSSLGIKEIIRCGDVNIYVFEDGHEEVLQADD